MSTIIAGGGPAGLTAAYELSKHGYACFVLEANPSLVGGISRTDCYKGYRFDIGGHRFFSKNEEVNLMWKEILGDQLLTRQRLSRIYYDRKYFDYPIRPVDAFLKLGPVRSIQVLASYIRARLFPIKPERSFEDWVVNRFGWQLFNMFFKSYTEKVWGMSTSEISADWAAQRIQGLSLTSAILSAFTSMKKGAPKQSGLKTLIHAFQYPRLGPGQMWEAVRDKVIRQGGQVHMDRKVVRVEHDFQSIKAFIAHDSLNKPVFYSGNHFISTLPIRSLIRAMHPAAPQEVLAASDSLKYRDFLTIILIVNNPHTFRDNWIYVHDPHVKLGRVQNFKNWSPDMVPDSNMTSLGLEYFCFEGDELWSMDNAKLIELASREIHTIGLIESSEVVDGCVVRMPKAYPVYDDSYQSHLRVIRNWLARFSNLELAGRNGMHKYNNQDHSMVTALLAARNIMGLGPYDTWKVNTDAEYHEVETEDRGRLTPRPIQ